MVIGAVHDVFLGPVQFSHPVLERLVLHGHIDRTGNMGFVVLSRSSNIQDDCVLMLCNKFICVVDFNNR